MPKRLTTQSMTIAELLKSAQTFVLPASQRVYGWSEDQLERLFSDLGISAPKEEEPAAAPRLPKWFFFGTIYLARRAGDTQAAIADGQQRIATATMLYAAARDLADDPAERARLDAYVSSGANAVRLKLREIDAAFFSRWVQADGATRLEYRDELADDDAVAAPLSDSQSNILKNRDLIVSRLASLPREGRQALLDLLENSSEVVVITADALTDAMSSYASTHKRGLRQAETDKLKSEIIGDAAADVRPRLANLWEESEALLGKDALEELLQLMVMSENGGGDVKDLQTELLAAFDLPEAAEPFVTQKLHATARAYRVVTRAPDSIHEYLGLGPIDRRRVRRLPDHLIGLQRVSHIEWRSPAVVALQSLKDNPPLLEQTLADLERLAVAFMLAGHDPHDCLKRYAAAARAIETRDGAAIQTVLTAEPSLRRKAREQLTSANFAQKSRYRMPMLLKVNDLLTKSVTAIDPIDVSCEHILPQSVDRRNPVWYGAFRAGGKYVGQLHRHRLGNLTILSHPDNRLAAARPWIEKKPILAKSTFEISRQAAKNSDWSMDVIQARTDTFARMLTDYWGL